MNRYDELRDALNEVYDPQPEEPEAIIKTKRGGYWLMAALIVLPWIAIGCGVMAIRSCN